jgi:hypothetical protein
MCERVQAKQLFGELRTVLNFSLPLAKDKGTEKTKQKIGVFQHCTKQSKEQSQFLFLNNTNLCLKVCVTYHKFISVK